MKDVAIEKFNEEGISFNKYYWKQDDKLEVAKNENIDVMIDDSYDVCKKLSSNGIKTIYFRDKEMKVLEQNENLKEVSNWEEIYRYIIVNSFFSLLFNKRLPKKVFLFLGNLNY